MTTQTVKGVRRGFVDILPVAMFVFPFGIGFGAAAIEKGISPLIATLMSATVMAGAAQFSALEFWSPPIPCWPLCVVVFAQRRH